MITSCNVVLHGFENERSSPVIWRENASVQTKNCVAAFSMMASKVSGYLIRQVFLLSFNGRHPTVIRVKKRMHSMCQLVTSIMIAIESRWRSMYKARCSWQFSACGLQLKLLRLLHSPYHNTLDM